MRKISIVLIVLLMVSGISSGAGLTGTDKAQTESKKAKVAPPPPPPPPPSSVASGDQDRLAVIWTSGDPEVAKKMVFLYTYNAKKLGWFKTIRFVIWGASTKLLSQDKELQDSIKKMKEIGIELYACKWCSDQYGVSEILQQLGVDVIYYGKPLTKLLKDKWNILTF